MTPADHLAPPSLREILDNFVVWRDHLMRWWSDHQPNERELEIARQHIKSRPDVLAEIERLNAERVASPTDPDLRAAPPEFTDAELWRIVQQARDPVKPSNVLAEVRAAIERVWRARAALQERPDTWGDRSDIEWLLAEVERLEGVVARLTEGLTDARKALRAIADRAVMPDGAASYAAMAAEDATEVLAVLVPPGESPP